MYFSIDIIWMGADFRIVDIKDSFPPCDERSCHIYQPARPARYVLELPAGYAAAQGLDVGLVGLSAITLHWWEGFSRGCFKNQF